jgi:hypothetical protein
MKGRRLAPVAWFFLGFGIFMFTRMSKIVPTIPVAMLIAPVFILRFKVRYKVHLYSDVERLSNG